MSTTKVYEAICAVMAELASEGISKDRRNTQGSGYNFRGIDDVYNALSRALAKHSLVIIPRVLSRECVERTSKSGGALFFTTVDVEFDIVSSGDGSRHTARTVGEAMDSGDKSSNKAMSAAYKYMAFQTFCIPTEGDNDADQTTHEVAPKPRSSHSMRQETDPRGDPLFVQMRREIGECETTLKLDKLYKEWVAKARKDNWKQGWKDAAIAEFSHAKKQLVEREQHTEPEDIFPGDLPNGRGQIISTLQAG